LRSPAYTDLTGSIYKQRQDVALLLPPRNAFLVSASEPHFPSNFPPRVCSNFAAPGLGLDF
jgi:hypothetical protein